MPFICMYKALAFFRAPKNKGEPNGYQPKNAIYGKWCYVTAYKEKDTENKITCPKVHGNALNAANFTNVQAFEKCVA